MRVISQKGMPVIIDLTYEYIAVSQSMEEPSCIIAYDVTTRDDSFFRMARYSTPEKAQKAMQMLHDEYSYIWKIKHGLDTYYGTETCIFRFPQDDEL